VAPKLHSYFKDNDSSLFSITHQVKLERDPYLPISVHNIHSQIYIKPPNPSQKKMTKKKEKWRNRGLGVREAQREATVAAFAEVTPVEGGGRIARRLIVPFCLFLW
jgi:hypothetical protein